MNKILFILFLVFITQSASAIPAEVSIITPQRINYNQTFDIQVAVNPNGNIIAGMQADILFNGTSIRVNKVGEGNLFTQNGASTFFNSGTIKSSSVVNIFDVILGKYNVSNYGIFITINVTSLSTGIYNVNLTNVKISSPEGVSVPLSTLNQSIKILRPYDVNGDFIIDITDITSVSQHFNEKTSYPYPAYDVNQDGVADISDIVAVAQHFGEIT